MFYSTKPGLSAYVDSPEMVSSLSGLLNSSERSRAWKTSPGVSPCINVIDDDSRQEEG